MICYWFGFFLKLVLLDMRSQSRKSLSGILALKHDMYVRMSTWNPAFEKSQQGRDFAKSGCNKKKFQWSQSYFYIMRKVWYHQIWIQNYFGFIMSDLMYVLFIGRGLSVAWFTSFETASTWYVLCQLKVAKSEWVLTFSIFLYQLKIFFKCWVFSFIFDEEFHKNALPKLKNGQNLKNLKIVETSWIACISRIHFVKININKAKQLVDNYLVNFLHYLH